MATKVEALEVIVDRMRADYRNQGKQFRLQYAVDEWERQCCESTRELESAILEAYPHATGDSLEARYLREVAEQITDHRKSGNYTTNCPHPRGTHGPA